MIRFRIDVDYPYPSRLRSFLYTALGVKTSGYYLKNPKIIAKMINESPKEVKAYWFFTSRTMPDKEMLKLMDNEKHEVALHVVNNPYAELRNLEKVTGKKLNYYTIHGTARLLARIMWGRWEAKAPGIPGTFPLKSFHQFPTEGIDGLSYLYPTAQVLKIAQDRIKEGCIVYFHPIWLFQRGKMNHRGAFYEPLKKILNVDSELDTLTVQRKILFTMARDYQEYQKDILPKDRFVEKLSERGVDIFTFIERSWSCKIPDPPHRWVRTNDNVALLRVQSYDQWLKDIGKKTRNMVRKAEKSGIRVELAELNESLAEGIWKIYNETPIRQGRGFSHFGARWDDVKRMIFSGPDFSYIGAYLEDELVGFVQLVHGNNIVIISQILSLQRHWDKALNNALVAKTVEVCANNHREWVMYGRMGNHPTLDNFKQSNEFCPFQLTRYYIPLTRKGKIAIKLGLHRELKDALPQAIKYPLIPLYNWISRTKMRIRLRLIPKQIF